MRRGRRQSGLRRRTAGEPTPEQVSACLDRLDRIAEDIAATTTYRVRDFRRGAIAFDSSEAQYRVVLMFSMLQKDHGILYNPEKIAGGTLRRRRV
jgi:hypothetical protein